MMVEEDIISSLPDDLLLEIISRIKIMDKETQEERFVSTKEVIRTTTTISKRWQHLWTLLSTLVFLGDDVRGHRDDRLTNYFSFISKTLTKCPTDVNIKKLKLQIMNVHLPTLQLNSWIHYAITRNVQEIDLRITNGLRDSQFCNDELFFNNSCLISLEVSNCVFDPPDGAIRWDKLKFLHIDRVGLDEDLIGKILSGSPCLETLELNDCHLYERIPKSFFENFSVLEHLSCKMETYERFSYDDELFLETYDSSLGMRLLRCVSNPPNGAIRLDKLKFLCIYEGRLDEDLIGKIFSRSPCLETLELNNCHLSGRIPKSLFGNFGVLECLSCDLETYERFRNDDELFLDDTCSVGMKLLRCVFNSPNGAIRRDKLKFLCIDEGKLDEDSIGNILARSPFLETLQLSNCCGFERIDVTSKSVKNLIISGYGYHYPEAEYDIHTIEINAPYILTLTIEGKTYLEYIFLENVSSLVKADLNFMVTDQFAEEVRQDESYIEEKLLRGLLLSLGHVNEIAVVTFSEFAGSLSFGS